METNSKLKRFIIGASWLAGLGALVLGIITFPEWATFVASLITGLQG